MPKRINIITCWKYIQKKSEVNIEGIWYTEVIYRTHSLDTWHSMFQAHSKQFQLHLHLSSLFLTIPLGECTGMFVVLDCTFIYVFFYSQVFNRKPLTTARRSSSGCFLLYLHFYLFIFTLNTSTSPPSIKSSPLSCGQTTTPYAFLLLAPIMGLSWSFGSRQSSILVILTTGSIGNETTFLKNINHYIKIVIETYYSQKFIYLLFFIGN